MKTGQKGENVTVASIQYVVNHSALPGKIYNSELHANLQASSY